MTSALLCTTRPLTAPTLAADLLAVGIAVLGSVPESSKLVQAVVLHAPDVLICDVPQPTSAWFQALKIVGQTVPCPVIVFTHDTDADHIAQATECGVHVYVVHGYGANRLRLSCSSRVVGDSERWAARRRICITRYSTSAVKQICAWAQIRRGRRWYTGPIWQDPKSAVSDLST